MATTINNADIALLAQEAIEANFVEIEGLKVFSTELKTEGMEEGDQVKVPVYGKTTAVDFNRSTQNYGDSQAQTVTFKSVILNQFYKSTFELNDKDVQKVDMSKVMMANAEAVVEKATTYVYGLITAANFTVAPTINVVPSAFDSDSVVDLSTYAKDNGFLKNNKVLVLNSAFANSLKKDPALKDASASGSTATLRSGEIGQLSGFNPILESSILPDNGEDLAGFITDGTSIAIASAPVTVEETGQVTTFSENFTEPRTGLTMNFRIFYDNDTGTHKGTYSMLFGAAVTRDATLNRITDATV
jgi:hypothetical protein